MVLIIAHLTGLCYMYVYDSLGSYISTVGILSYVSEHPQ